MYAQIFDKLIELSSSIEKLGQLTAGEFKSLAVRLMDNGWEVKEDGELKNCEGKTYQEANEPRGIGLSDENPL